MFLSRFKMCINLFRISIISQDRLIIYTPCEEIMSLFIELLFSRVFSNGIKLYRTLVCHMLILSICLHIFCYLMIFAFSMTNKTPHQCHSTPLICYVSLNIVSIVPQYLCLHLFCAIASLDKYIAYYRYLL